MNPRQPDAVSAVSAVSREFRCSESSRRILAAVLPSFLCEVALVGLRTAPSLSSTAFAVVVTNDEGTLSEQRKERRGQLTLDSWEPAPRELAATTRLDAASHRAQQCGIRAGQTIAEARSLVPELRICRVSHNQIRQALERIADSFLKFATVVSFEVQTEDSLGVRLGTLWLDITGVAHLFGGESALAHEVCEVARSLGHQARVAIANGPLLAHAFARWGSPRKQGWVLDAGEIPVRARELPITALPVAAEPRRWLARLGVLTFADLEKIPRAFVASRLGVGAQRALELLQGIDRSPLNPYIPPAAPSEQVHWDEAVSGVEPLLFALRGLTSKLGARLEGRAMAAQKLRLVVYHDRGIARFRHSQSEWVSDFELASPLYRADELWKVISARLSNTRLPAPSVGLRLEVSELTEARQRQLPLHQAESKLEGTPEAMAVLFGELAADIGRHRFGVLELEDSHRPEQMGGLVSATELEEQVPSKTKKPRSVCDGEPSVRAPTRLLNPAMLLTASFRVGEIWPIGFRVYTVKNLQFLYRLDGVEWWSKQPTSRDYYRAWLESPSGSVDVLVYWDRWTGQRYLQGFYD